MKFLWSKKDSWISLEIQPILHGFHPFWVFFFLSFFRKSFNGPSSIFTDFSHIFCFLHNILLRISIVVSVDIYFKKYIFIFLWINIVFSSFQNCLLCSPDRSENNDVFTNYCTSCSCQVFHNEVIKKMVSS